MAGVLERNVADGVHRLGHAAVNVYFIEDDSGITVVDTGLPATFRHLEAALAQLGRSVGDVRAVVLTHAHFDHVGSARRIRKRWQVPVWVHAADQYLAAHPYRYAHEKARVLYPLRYPRSIPYQAKMAAAGALVVRGLPDTMCYSADTALEVPGRPRVVFSPGHTLGHCGLHLADRDTLISGDALVTLDPYTGVAGPQIVSGAATADSTEALASLSALADTGAKTVLPGHGEPWYDGIAAAAQAALQAGPS
ncbi:MBL fold metallo-hydrolase [Mycolicibacter sinensis]|uniref:Zn-dependent hydrolase n=1 Tax=Mycolicibacter sinensis (strain JDM601) TaxID=875328 RepID=A0A1A2XUF7_MYCSD|nr:MBL fold metallo-hydrolase [Mycolicibacter sinensis]OBH18397.1 Zn-dependent hydrolase [Mycolicibacter sinensis]OBI29379.1 Zn-dependent hydrolase [Mycolicibacter sinensis]